MSGGYIKLHRGWHSDEMFQDAAYCERAAWVWLLTNAAYKETVRRTGTGGVVTLKRGQIHVSLSSLASAWGWSIKRVRGYLERLEKGHTLGTHKGKAGTVVTICNYDKYQGLFEFEGHTQGTPSGTRRAHAGHTQEESKERKERNTGAVARPEDVSPEVWIDFCKTRRAKKAPITETALAGIRREADLAGWTMDAACAEVATRGWTGFKAEWVKGKSGANADPEYTGP